MERSLLKDIEKLHQAYSALKLSDIIDYDKYKLYSLVTSSTQLEGATLDEGDTKLLLDDGLTAKGKPMLDHKMVEDNFSAIKLAIDSAKQRFELNEDFLCRLNALNMKQTGAIVHTAIGKVVDGTKGELRKDSRFAQAIGTYPDWKKVPWLLKKFCDEYNRQIKTNKTSIENLISSFDAHINLVLIHPWMDGNKRTSRIVMNYIQTYCGLPLTKVHKEDGKEYWSVIKETKEKNNLDAARMFLSQQHLKTLEQEITSFKRSQKKHRGMGLILF